MIALECVRFGRVIRTAALLCAWVGAVVDRGQLGGGELGVALGGGEALVAEQLLNGAQIGAFFEQVGAEGVAQSVRVNVGGQAAQDGDALDDAADAARGETGLAAFLKATQLQIEEESRRVEAMVVVQCVRCQRESAERSAM